MENNKVKVAVIQESKLTRFEDGDRVPQDGQY